ncbi:hypothetical protein CDL15_Pgr025335 [Punica granatum]|uniref:FBD domain-containing protein n=1 Tax=Punica granatum TaxID=22663 RepID=A0A218W9J5_PUNGR|nr:hypothetical protein CDL15_Pgr025335 [Punica granatum]
MKEAARCSILSCRWRYMWLYIPNLDFSVSPETAVYIIDHPRKRCVETRKFIRWVNELLAASRAPILDNFRVDFCLDVRHSREIDSWVQFAVEKRVKHLQISCFSDGSGKHQNYSFPMLQARPLSSIALLKSLCLDYVNAYFCTRFPELSCRERKRERRLQHMQVVEYVGYYGRKGDHQLILHLLWTVVSPEKLVIDLLLPAENCLNSEDMKLQERTMKLGPKLPAGVELVIK